MKKIVVRKIIRILILLVGITFLSFALSYLSPGDPAQIQLSQSGMRVNAQTLAKVRKELGLDRPMLVQYLSWLKGILTGNMGISYKSRKSVALLLQKAIPNTILLTFVSLFVMVLISTPTGIICAWKKNGIFDHAVRVITYLFSSLPSFFLALIFLYFLALKLKWFTVLPKGMSGIVMPALTLSLTLGAWYVRQIRAMVLKELQQDYVKGLMAKGFSDSTILFGHVLKNCLSPLITLFSMSVGSMLGGTAIVESIFVWNGVGKLAVDSISARDYPVIQGYVVWMALIFLSLNFLADIICRMIDPRIRREARS
ncbi:ABC transporter permease [Butyrivibrio sp. AE3006]|uniref:ABC transporter permease n=1 Tax=Butyrivibrio sp. AE3006 TaxID=1280673 RepID=UPI0004287C22|nr:ABC transporter permease [Butyrivibrio sp. AE3006]